MMNKSYQIKKYLAPNFNFVLFCSSLFLEKIYSILIFNIADLILLEKIQLKKTKGRQIYLHDLQLKNMQVTSHFDYIVLFRRQISNYSMQKQSIHF